MTDDIKNLDDLLKDFDMNYGAQPTYTAKSPSQTFSHQPSSGGFNDMDELNQLVESVKSTPNPSRPQSTAINPNVRASTGPGPGFSRPASQAITPNVSTGPGPGFVRPGPAGRGGAGFQGMATHTPAGLKVKVSSHTCDYCQEPIVGRYTTAMNKEFHPEHFVCVVCSQPFPGGAYLEFEGKAYCEPHYNEMHAPRCFRCNDAINERLIRALNHTWHAEHFNCTGCGTALAGKTFKEAGGEPYCATCKHAMDIKLDAKIHMCATCKRPIIGEYILLAKQYHHPEHYRCTACGKEFLNGDCHEYQGHLYCKEDFDKLQKECCAGCRKPIVGRSLTAMGRSWHPEHFTCAHCLQPFGGSKYFEMNYLPYCEAHYRQLFGKRCAKCDLPIIEHGIEILSKIWHKECFVCQGCDSKLDPSARICSWEGKPLCKHCYLKLPKKVRETIEKKQQGEDKMEKARQKERDREIATREREANKREAAARREAKKGGDKFL